MTEQKSASAEPITTGASDTLLKPKPSYIDLPTEQLRIWELGEGPTLLVLPGLINSPQAVCSDVAQAFPRHRIVALELPGLGTSPASIGRTIEDIAAAIDSVADTIDDLAGCIACDLAISAALQSSIAAHLTARLLLVDLSRARFLAIQKPVCGNFDLDGDGTYLTRLWNHVRDVDMLESFEPKRPRGHGVYKSPEDLDEAFLSFAVQPAAYGELWRRLAKAIQQLDPRQLDSVTVVEILNSIDPAIFAAPRLTRHGKSSAAASALAIKRGYEDISAGRIHYRTAGTGENKVIALLAGAFSSSVMSPLLLNLSGNHTVVAPDYIGQGDSCRAPQETTIARAAAEIDELTRKLGWSHYSVYGTQTGAGVALEMAIGSADRVKNVVIDSCSMQHASERVEHRIRYFPPISPDVWGTHVFKTWNMLKDGEVFWPWYLPVCASAKESASPGLDRLHDSAICTLRSRTTPVYKSMSSYEARNRVGKVHQPVLFVTGPKDIFERYVPEAKRLAPENFTFLDVPGSVLAAKGDPKDVEKTCQIFEDFFLQSP